MNSLSLFYIVSFLLLLTVVLMLTLEDIQMISMIQPHIWMTSNKSLQRRNVTELKKTNKWIVVTSIQYPTQDVKRLASLPEWTIVVVGDKKTPSDWSLPHVHYLSIDDQESLGFSSIRRLPYGSYTRKNAGYLYAIANGAQWIYDTDDDNKPFGKGLEQFDYGDTVDGLRYHGMRRKENNLSSILFNPYQHFGSDQMWPRGFPLESIKGHSHPEGSYRLCKKMKAPAVQQGLVHKDPDVDAIFRLLHASSTEGLNERFNPFAPPVVLNTGTFSPWNSQNTLFSRRSFFGLFLPTTVSFRVTDIWRSYFTQTLLHAAGETISFTPVNAIQIRNSHDYLKDFDQEIDVYEKAGEMVKFIHGWNCQEDTMEKCIVDLAQKFSDRGFWGKEDVELIESWVKDLIDIGYEFPRLVNTTESQYSLGDEKDIGMNCRRAHVHFRIDLPSTKEEKAIKRAETLVKDFGDFKEWCDICNSSFSSNWLFPTVERVADHTLLSKPLTNNHYTVAIITNNWVWQWGIGMMQRLYESSFGVILLCGTKGDIAPMWENSLLHQRGKINYIHLSSEESKWGYWMYYCLSKVTELRLQNVQGYFMFSDDMIHNSWTELDLNIPHGGIRSPGYGPWWQNEQFGLNASMRTAEIIRERMAKGDKEVQELVNEYTKSLSITNYSVPSYLPGVLPISMRDPLQHLSTMDGWVVADWMYIPSHKMNIAKTFAEVSFKGGFHHELFASKLMYAINGQLHSESFYLWGTDRDKWPTQYKADLISFHPIKMSQFSNVTLRKQLCDVVLNTFYTQLIGISSLSLNETDY